MRGRRPGPPRAAELLLSLFLPRGGVRASVLGDLHEMHGARAADPAVGPARADLWYWGHALRVGLGYLGRRLRRVGIPALTSTRRPWDEREDVMGDLIRDVGYALRGFVRAPAFFGVAILTLALGVGANTAVFSVVNAVYLRPLDFREPERVARVGLSALDGSYRMETHTAGTWSDWREAQTSFEAFAGYRFWTTTVEVDGVASRMTSVHSLGSLFDVLGVPALVGRTFTAEEEGPGAENLVVLSYAYWQQELGGRDLVGGSLVVEGVPHEILGVMPPSFAFPTPGTRFWKTSDLTAGQLLDRDDQFVNSLGRLAPGRTLEQARDELVRIHDELRRTHPEQLANSTPELVPLADVVRRQAGSLWLTLMGAVGLVLLIACLNLANLLLSRAAAREGELAVRRALGAGRGRLTRLVAAETLALSLLGGLAGLGVGWLLLRGILAWMPGGVPRAEVVGMDGRVLAFAVLVTGAAGLLFGLAPALRLAEGSLGARMRRGRGGTHLVRHGLVAAEIALAVVLVTGAGLTIRGYGVVGAVDPGFVAVDRAVFPVELQGEVSDGERSLFYRGLEGEVRRLPGVASAGVTSVYPMAGFTPGSWVGRPGGAPAAEGSPTVRYVGVSPAFREAAGIPLRRGRDLGDGDGRAGAPALLLSESAAALLFPGEDALGQQVYLGPEGVVAPVSTVVGVVGDVRQRGMAADPPPMAYVPRDNLDFWRGFHLVVESDLPADALAGEVRRIAAGLGSSALVLRPTRADGFVAGAMRSQRDVMLLFGLLAGVALVLAMVGVFGVVSYLVSRRRREIGVRMAVGAGRAEVQALVLAQSLVPAGLGAALGVLGAAWLSRFMEALVAGVEPTDALTFVTVPVALVAVTALASWLPARRAAALDPVRVLSAE